jgi:hypothetical protein
MVVRSRTPDMRVDVGSQSYAHLLGNACVFSIKNQEHPERGYSHRRTPYSMFPCTSNLRLVRQLRTHDRYATRGVGGDRRRLQW